MSILWLDYESRSPVDLSAAGAHNYARHPQTQALCMAYAFGDEEVELWWRREPFPQRVREHFASGRQIRAHNEEFDRLITWYVVCQDYDLPEPPLEAWYCTAAQARANCAPGSLEDVGRFAGASMKKDHRGAALVRACCIPPYNDDPEMLRELGEYAKQDVRAMRAASLAMRQLSEEELRDYHVNARINMRGVRIDRDLCAAAARYAEQERVEIEQIFREVTQGTLTSVRSPKMREWVFERVGPQARQLMEVMKNGEKKVSIDKSVRASLLALAEEDPEEVPAEVADIVQCADDLWASSVAKFQRAANLADRDDARVRGAFVFAGGAATGRASSYGLQLHNYPRKCAKDPELTRQAMVRGHALVPTHGKRVTDVLKSMLRPSIIPAGDKHLVVADWSAIEGRVNPWLAASEAGDAKLDVFRSGLDPYKVNAAATFQTTYEAVTGDQRQIGKVQELSLGFAGGVGALSSMARNYGMSFAEREAKRMVAGWRAANPWAMPFWEGLENAYRRALRNKGYEFSAGRITYLFDGRHLWYALPSGRVLCYPYARLDGDEITYAKAAWKPAADAKEWPRARLWRGLACENVTQAAAHDILRHSLARLEAEGHEVVAHVHDEIVVETREPERALEAMRRIMCTPPNWAGGLPLNIEAHAMTRYGKG